MMVMMVMMVMAMVMMLIRTTCVEEVGHENNIVDLLRNYQYSYLYLCFYWNSCFYLYLCGGSGARRLVNTVDLLSNVSIKSKTETEKDTQFLTFRVLYFIICACWASFPSLAIPYFHLHPQVGGHFHLPPQWFRPQQIDAAMYSNISQVVDHLLGCDQKWQLYKYSWVFVFQLKQVAAVQIFNGQCLDCIYKTGQQYKYSWIFPFIKFTTSGSSANI